MTRLGDYEAACAIFDAVTAVVPGMDAVMAQVGVPRDSPMWMEVVWNLSEADVTLHRGRPL